MDDKGIGPRPAVSRVTRRRVLGVLAFVAFFSSAALYRTVGWAQSEDDYPVVDLDLTQPDVLIRTRSLSSLSRDLLRVPLAQDLLGEDVVFYYETHPDRLGLMGSLRRISYEHDLSWTDRLVSTVFDEPADVMLWRGPKGALDYWAIAMTRGSLATVLQEAATVATKDRQLTRAGELTVDGARVAVYAFEYAPARTLVIAARGDRLVVLSERGLIGDGHSGFRDDPAAAVSRLLSANEDRRRIFDTTFPPNRDGLTHSVAARLNFLSFGYQQFFPGVDALKFDFGDGQWSTSVLLDGAALPGGAFDDRGLWNAVPANAGLCASLPVDWARGREVAAALAASAQAGGDLWQELEGPALACWYGDARIHTPLIVATLKNPRPALEPLLTSLFDWGVKKPAEAAPVPARRAGADETWWQREMEVPFTSVDRESGRPEPGLLNVTLAARGRQVFFSPDAQQVSRALDAVSRRYPSMADTLPLEGVTLATIAPARLATLGRQEALTMLPRPDEPVFREAAEQRLLPKLDRLARYPAYRLTLTAAQGTARRWEPVAWQELAR